MNDAMKVFMPSGEIAARDNLVLAFFGKRPFSEMAQGAGEALAQWLGAIPRDQLTWVLIGKDSAKYKKLTPAALAKCQEALAVEVAAASDTFVRICGPEAIGPDYRATIKGYRQPQKIAFADETSLVEFVFPANFHQKFGAGRFVALAAKMFDLLGCDSGYASPALYYGLRGEYEQAAEFIAAHAFQHHGFDVPNNVSTAVSMGVKCRGARWLTMLSSDLVKRAGGLDSLKREIEPGVEILALSSGVLLRAGEEPEIGAVNRGIGTPLVASVARAVEGITYFNDDSLLPLFGDDADRRDHWERRFWWREA